MFSERYVTIIKNGNEKKLYKIKASQSDAAFSQHIITSSVKVVVHSQREITTRFAVAVTIPTFLCWVDGGHWTKRTFSLVVVNPNFDLIRRERRDALVLEDVSRGFWGCDSSLHPALCPKWAESYHVAKAWTALQLLRNRLRKYEMTQRDDSRWLILKILIPKSTAAMHGLGHLGE